MSLCETCVFSPKLRSSIGLYARRNKPLHMVSFFLTKADMWCTLKNALIGVVGFDRADAGACCNERVSRWPGLVVAATSVRGWS